jgi:hypothetical protein
MREDPARTADVSAALEETRNYVAETLSRLTWNFGWMMVAFTIIMTTAIYVIR